MWRIEAWSLAPKNVLQRSVVHANTSEGFTSCRKHALHQSKLHPADTWKKNRLERETRDFCLSIRFYPIDGSWSKLWDIHSFAPRPVRQPLNTECISSTTVVGKCFWTGFAAPQTHVGKRNEKHPDLDCHGPLSNDDSRKNCWNVNLLHANGQDTGRVSAATFFPIDEQLGCRVRGA